MRVARAALYWLAVLAVSLVLVFLLVLALESRDEGAIEAAAMLARV